MNKRIIIYPSYSTRDYKTNTYLLDIDPAFHQSKVEAEMLAMYFDTVLLIVPEKNQSRIIPRLIPENVILVSKKYEYNVGAERFRTDDVDFFKSLNFQKDDVFYTNFLTKQPIFSLANIPVQNSLYTFLYFYPGINVTDFSDLSLSKGIIFRSEKAKDLFYEKGYTGNNTYVMKPYKESIFNIIPRADGKRSVILPSRMDHEDHNHSWEALSLLLALKNEIDFNLIVSNVNSSANLNIFKDLIDEIGPFSRDRYEEIIYNQSGVIFSKKACDFDGSKGAPEYLGSNMIFISNDYQINPYDVKENDNSIAYSLIKKYLTCSKEDYHIAKDNQIKLAEKHHGLNQISNIFNKIFMRDKK